MDIKEKNIKLKLASIEFALYNFTFLKYYIFLNINFLQINLFVYLLTWWIFPKECHVYKQLPKAINSEKEIHYGHKHAIMIICEEGPFVS